ncbi:hypothetical protein EII25_04885 [Erysipelotrichaceae bacterium OH741_COT-311]|nr:hypothetical protein [Erysipelotrichaceae bacterium]MDO5085403.1 hypothetical protein [Erysipelotrichaceae bacterium]RRC92143.1 hypothetical protein EII25_04885 [Erysipelotrichaceae bacterium OH741_COT-311]
MKRGLSTTTSAQSQAYDFTKIALEQKLIDPANSPEEFAKNIVKFYETLIEGLMNDTLIR